MALEISIDGRLIQALPEQNLLATSLQTQFEVPYFCWHPAMGSVGACRQCAVKIFQGPEDVKGRIVMACMTKPLPDMRVSIDDPEAVKFRAGVIELVLTNHPHDCPVCEVGGECHLQDMTVLTGHHQRRYNFPKRTHRNQNLGPLIRHEMNRCIGCYRCVRYYRDYAGSNDFGVFGAHRNIYFGRASDGVLESAFSGNLIEVCPTGVFVDKPFSAKFRRKWDLASTPSVCPHCAVGCNITLHERDGQLRRAMNRYNETLNGYFLCDRGRFGVGFVESPARLRHNHDRAGNMLKAAEAQARLAGILAAGDVIGIGSSRASIEDNFALRALVGADHFYAGCSAFDASVLATYSEITQQIRPATLAQVEQADAFLLLGDDPALIAPRLALSLRQAARQADGAGVARRSAAGAPHMFITATAAPGWLDDVTHRVHAGPSLEFASGLLAALTGTAQASASADILLASAHPVIVAGGDAALLATAARIVVALRRRGVSAQLSLLLPEANSAGLAMLCHRDLAAAARAAAGRHIVVLERDILREPIWGTLMFATAKSVTVIDHIATASVQRADTAIAVASFAESDGTFINLEGRAQAFHTAVTPAAPPPAAWHVLRDAAISAGRLAPGDWATHASLMAAIAGVVPVLAPCVVLWDDKPCARSTSTDGAANTQPGLAGWHSAQFGPQNAARGVLPPEVFVFEDGARNDIAIPPATAIDDRELGFDELSELSPAIIAHHAAVTEQ